MIGMIERGMDPIRLRFESGSNHDRDRQGARNRSRGLPLRCANRDPFEEQRAEPGPAGRSSGIGKETGNISR